MSKNANLFDLIITTDIEPRLQQVGITYTPLLPDTLEHRIWLAPRDPDSTYYLVELPAGTQSRKREDDSHTLTTTVAHTLPGGRLLTEVRTYAFDDALYRTSWFELGKEHEGVVESDTSGKFPGRFSLHYYDNDLDQHESRVLATGTAVELLHDGAFVAGRVEHRLPDGYFFQPIPEAGIPPFPLEHAMVARLTVWEYSEEQEGA